MKNQLNSLFYYYKRNNWMWYPKRFVSDFSNTKIDRPIFFLGNQGDGITLISRFFRRHSQVVSVTGNNKYWTGADEMQRVMELRLPYKLRLSGKTLSTDPHHSKYFQPRSWSYGIDELYQSYHNTEKDFSEKDKVMFEKAIREPLYRFGNGNNSRFIDKSQVYTLKTRYIQALLDEYEPYFILFTRNPYVTCARAAKGKAGDMNRYKFLSFDEKFNLCIEHWANCMETVIKDSKYLRNFRVYRFEDFLKEPKKQTKDLCDFLDLNFEEEMLPAPNQFIPFGTKYGKRWYPIKQEINKPYLEKMTDKQLDKVETRCGKMALEFGYHKDWKKNI